MSDLKVGDKMMQGARGLHKNHSGVHFKFYF